MVVILLLAVTAVLFIAYKKRRHGQRRSSSGSFPMEAMVKVGLFFWILSFYVRVHWLYYGELLKYISRKISLL